MKKIEKELNYRENKLNRREEMTMKLNTRSGKMKDWKCTLLMEEKNGM